MRVLRQHLSPQLTAAFQQRLNYARVPPLQHSQYHKWLRLYACFCQKFGYPPAARTSLGPFLTQLAANGLSIEQRHRAAAAVKLLLQPDPLPLGPQSPSPLPSPLLPPGPRILQRPDMPSAPSVGNTAPPQAPSRSALNPAQYSSSWEREYRDLESAIRLRNYSSKTLAVYRVWVSKFQAFVRSRPTGQLGTQEVRGFLSALAVQHRVSASSQNQAFNSLLFFFRHVLGREFGKVDGVVRAKRHRYVPVVLSRAEVDAVLAHLEPPYRLVVLLLYGCGLRLAECVIPDIFSMWTAFVHALLLPSSPYDESNRPNPTENPFYHLTMAPLMLSNSP